MSCPSKVCRAVCIVGAAHLCLTGGGITSGMRSVPATWMLVLCHSVVLGPQGRHKPSSVLNLCRPCGPVDGCMSLLSGPHEPGRECIGPTALRSTKIATSCRH